MQKNSVRRLCEAGVIAALYTALTVLMQPIAFGPVQVRLSEALTILPVGMPSAIGGLSVGCALSNLLCIATNPAGAWDVLFGTAATLAAALCTRALRRVRWFGLPIAATLPPVLFNAVVVGLELSMVYFDFSWGTFALCAVQVAAGELLSATLAGLILWRFMPKSLSAR